MHISRRAFLQASGAAALAHSALPTSAFTAQAPNALSESDLLAKLAADPLRPQLHLLPAKNWMNDPNGPIFWNGRYHMFYQYNPNAPVWGDMHWGHAVSDDMIHWRNLPIALAPTPGSGDADGCFTGSAVNDHGLATILYTGVKSAPAASATLRDGSHNFREVQCLATSRDPMLRQWQKFPAPVLQPPDNPLLTGFRDPFLWRQGDSWYLGIGSGLRRQGGRVFLYRSSDLRRWDFLHDLASGQWSGVDNANPVASGEMWECPDFFPLGRKHVLLYATEGKPIWQVGDFDPRDLRFHPEKSGLLDHGAYYAQKSQLDANGNRTLWGWVPETRPERDYSAAGWAGCISLPRLVSLGADGGLHMSFAPQTQSLRAKHFVLPPASAPNERAAALHAFAIEGLCGEIIWKIAAPTAPLELRDRAGAWWSMTLSTEGAATTLTVNGTRIALSPAASPQRSFHLFLDASVAELICDGRFALTSRIYRKPDGPLRLSLPENSLRSLISLEAWQLRPISRDRLTH